MSFVASLRGSRHLAVMGRFATARWLTIGLVAAPHLAALAIMVWGERSFYSACVFLLVWGSLNFFFLLLFRRPGISAALSLALIAATVALSQFKFTILWMTINFFDLLIVDSDTIAFLLSIFPDLRATLVIVVLLSIPVLVLLWRLDPFRVRRTVSAAAAAGCVAGMTGLSLAVPEEPWEQFQGGNHISAFVRSGVMTASELMTRGWIDYDSASGEQFRLALGEGCHPAKKPPHIIMVLDEASFDISASPGIKVPPGYARHFKSFDGKTRSMLVEGSGGPTWYTEYNVLAGLSARSYGRLSFYVTRIAAGRVERGLPQALKRCGYKTASLYPAYGAFLSARKFQTTLGVQRFVDSNDMKAGDVEPDRFFYDQAVRMLANERGSQPMFMFVYTLFNHFPWWNRLRPELTPDWRDLGNEAEVDEYIRRQTLSAQDYVEFKKRLRREFPDEQFLIVRFGDHQPSISARTIDPAASDETVAKSMMSYDPRYYSTYYAIDTINFDPVDVSSALDRLEAPYLPLVIQEAAGLPLDPTFVEQKKIMARCNGLFFACAGGAEARRFNRLLIDAGLIKGLVSR